MNLHAHYTLTMEKYYFRCFTIMALLVFTMLSGCISNDEGKQDSNGDYSVTDGSTQIEQSSGNIRIAGSSTVYPLATGWAEGFREEIGSIQVSVASGGSGVGASAVCSTSNDHVDIGSMSRTFKPIEATLESGTRYFSCKPSDIVLTQMPIAMDGVTLIVARGGDADRCIQSIGGLSVAQLRWIYSDWSETDLVYSQFGGLDLSSVTPNNDDDGVREWKDLGDTSDCLDQEISLWGPDLQSGTYEYFGEMVFCTKCFAGERDYPVEAFASQRGNGYQNSANDNVIVNGVSQDGAAIGFFGYSYYEAHQSVLHSVPISANLTHSATDGIEDVIQPTISSIKNQTYLPLSREIYLNIDNSSWAKVLPFMEFGYSSRGQEIISEVGFVPLPESIFNESMAILNLHTNNQSETSNEAPTNSNEASANEENDNQEG